MNKKTLGDIFFSIVIAILAGILIFKADEMINMATLILGITFIIYSIYNLFCDIKATKKSLISISKGIIILVLGILLVIHPSFINDFITLVIGIYILLVNISNLLHPNNNKVITKIISIIGIIVGLLCVVGKFLPINFIFQLTGMFLLVSSIINIVETILMAEK